MDSLEFKGFARFRYRLEVKKNIGLCAVLDRQSPIQLKLKGGSSRTSSSSSILERYGRWILQFDEDGIEDSEYSPVPGESAADFDAEKQYRSETTRYLMTHGRDFCRGWIHSHPITSIQIISGCVLYLGDLFWFFPSSRYLFHPVAVVGPHWQLFRAATNFASLGKSLWEVGSTVGAMILWNSDVELWLNGGGDVVIDGKVVQYGTQRLVLDVDRKDPRYGTRKTTWEWLVTKNKYLKYQLVSGALLIMLETTLYFSNLHYFSRAGASSFELAHAVSFSGQYRGARHVAQVVLGYSLVPELIESVRWLWTLMAPTNSVYLFGVVPVNPTWLPLASLVLNGFTSWRTSLKGLAACLLASYILDLRRPDAMREPIVFYFRRILRSFGVFTKSVISSFRLSNASSQKSKRAGKAARQQTEPPKRAPSSSDSSLNLSLFEWTVIGDNQVAPSDTAVPSATIMQRLRSMFI